MADEPNEVELAQVTGAGVSGIRGRNKRLGPKDDLEGGGGAAHASDSDNDSDAASDKAPTGAAASHVHAVRSWWRVMRRHFGDALLLQIFFVYFTQGLRSTLSSLGTSYFLNETLALPPAQSEALRATAAIPWIIKPLYGMLSDSVPLWGTRRKSYLLLFSAVSALAYVALSVPGLITRYVRE